MSNLTPLLFPEDKQSVAHSASEFPYAALPGGTDLSGQPMPAGAQPNRMQQLEAMLQEAQGRAEIIEKEAYDKAYLAGEKAGMALGKKRGDQILETLQSSLSEAEQELVTIQQAFAEAATDLAGFIAEQIIGESLSTKPDALWNIAKQAATQLPVAAELRIAVSPDDYAVFKRLIEEESSMAVLSSDASIRNGSCRIISSQQDMLIDPVGAVQHYLAQLRPTLLQASDDDRCDTTDDERHGDANASSSDDSAG